MTGNKDSKREKMRKNGIQGQIGSKKMDTSYLAVTKKGNSQTRQDRKCTPCLALSFSVPAKSDVPLSSIQIVNS